MRCILPEAFLFGDMGTVGKTAENPHKHSFFLSPKIYLFVGANWGQSGGSRQSLPFELAVFWRIAARLPSTIRPIGVQAPAYLFSSVIIHLHFR